MRLRSIARGAVCWLVLLVFAGGATPAMAQGVGSIGGTVADSSGGVLPGATVTLTAAAGGIGSGQTTMTNEQGRINLPGSYLTSIP